MVTVRAIHLSPVKSLRLARVERAELGHAGIPGDRAFMLLDPAGRALTMRVHGALARIESEYDPARDVLTLRLPDGTTLSEQPRALEPFQAILWGRIVGGHVVDGPFGAALSELVGREVRLVRVDDELRALDAHAVSILSWESVEELSRQAGLAAPLDPRRFRPTLLVEGGAPHMEDAWVGTTLRAGEAVLRVVRRDPRCSLTTRHPESGKRDADTLRWLNGYRPEPAGESPCLGVYADVVEPGAVAVGDPVEVLG